MLRKWVGACRSRCETPSSGLSTWSWRRSRSCAPVHELSLSSAIVNTVEKHAAGRRVTIVSLRIGAMRQVVPDTLEFYFEFVARGSVCEGAVLEQELIAALLRCR